MADEEARREAEREIDTLRIETERKLTEEGFRVQKAISAAEGEREKAATAEERQYQQKVVWPHEAEVMKGERGYLDIAREDIQKHEIEKEEIRARSQDAGQNLDSGELGTLIMRDVTAAKDMFERGWKDFDRSFPGILSKQEYDMLKQMDKPGDVTKILMERIAQQYIGIHGPRWKAAERDLVHELSYFLKADDDIIKRLQAEYDSLPSGGRGKASGKGMTWVREKLLGGEEGSGTSVFEEGAKGAIASFLESMEKLITFPMKTGDYLEQAKEKLKGREKEPTFPSLFPWARAKNKDKNK